MNQTDGHAFAPKDSRGPARLAVVSIAASIGLIFARGVAGPAKPMPIITAAPPWPPWFLHLHLALWAMPVMSWSAVLLGATGLVAALIASRRGWQPEPRRLIAASVVAVIALMLTPSVNVGDPLFYAAYGRIASLGHSPYVAEPTRVLSAGDPVATALQIFRPIPPSRYGPVATLSEEAAAALGGDSPARIIFWIKMWNAIAFLVLVFVLDRLMRPDRKGRVRAHLMWSLNPLMLILIMADGHNDVLAVAMAAPALFAVKKSATDRIFWAGILVVLATAVKSSYALFGAGLAWAARHRPRAFFALAAGAAGAAAVFVPAYFLGGGSAVAATTFGLVGGEHTNLLFYEFARVTGNGQAVKEVNLIGLFLCGALALLLLWRLPPGPSNMPGVRVTLALALALLVASPYQRAWYDAMIFPLLAVVTASRLDWVAAAHTIALTVISVPYFYPQSHPPWWAQLDRFGSDVPVLLTLAATGAVLLWLCWTGNWRQLAPEAPVRGDLDLALPLSTPAVDASEL